jgi:predicted metal-dependent phosphoesterase TrpH
MIARNWYREFSASIATFFPDKAGKTIVSEGTISLIITPIILKSKPNIYIMHFDLHVHSKYSYDCRSPIEKILKTAQKKRIDGLAIMDHNTVAGYLAAKPLADSFGLHLVPGYELKTKDGDLLLYGITDLLKPFQPASESIESARELGAVIVAAHPYDPFRKGIGDLIGRVKIDGVEVANSHCVNNRKAKKAALDYGLAQVGGSDAHICAEIASCYTLCDDEPLTAIRTGRCTAIGGFRVRSLPLAMAHGLLTIPGRVRERVKRWNFRRRRRM